MKSAGKSTRGRTWGWLIPIVALIGLSAAGWWRQTQQTATLRVELARVQMAALERDHLRDANQQLLASQVSNAELENLRADHAALIKLRAELEMLKGRTTPVP
jgi:pyruvate carboxylase